MKRSIAAAAIGGLILTASAGFLEPAPSSQAVRTRRVAVFAGLGVMMNGFIFPNEFVFGLKADVRLAKFLMVCPEVQVWTHRFRFSEITVAPAATLNLVFGGFYAGGGAIAMRGGYGGWAPGPDWTWRRTWVTRPTFNVGYTTRHFKLGLSATPIDDGIAAVWTAGYGF